MQYVKILFTNFHLQNYKKRVEQLKIFVNGSVLKIAMLSRFFVSISDEQSKLN